MYIIHSSSIIRWLIVLLALPFLQSCIDPYNPSLTLNANLIVVSGIVTDLDESQTISLNRSRSSADSMNVNLPIQRANVQVIVNGTTPVTLLEKEPGIYGFPTDFRGKVGNTYQLRFQTEEGATYESSVETMQPVPPIQKTYDQFNPEGPKKTADGLPIPANDIYIDFQDPASERNFYLWRWRLYEIQQWCATCQQGRYVVRDVGPIGSGPLDIIGCVRDSTLGTLNLFDYPCREQCWDIFYNTDIIISSDIYSNGQTQIGKKVASIPIYQRDPALIVVEQLALSANAYRYYKLFADQVQNTGTLADSPPAPIAGNVKNVANSLENVVGYFSATSVAVSRYKIDRKAVTSGLFQGLFYAVNGRFPKAEPTSALCIPSRSRTNLFPPGWNQ
ncbi:DUF4249 domain-containing protein [Spirosoma jeollabukense]